MPGLFQEKLQHSVLQEASTSRSDFQIEVRDPVKHGDGVSVCVFSSSCRLNFVIILTPKARQLAFCTGTCIIQGHYQN